jgi:hypothetical protein
MSEPISREEFLAHATPIQEDVRRIVSLLEKQSMQVSDVDKRLAIIEDRQPTRTAIQWGGISGGTVTLIYALVDYFAKSGR